MLRLALLSIHGFSILRLFNRMSWPAIARSRGVTLFRSNAIEIFIGKLTQASDREGHATEALRCMAGMKARATLMRAIASAARTDAAPENSATNGRRTLARDH